MITMIALLRRGLLAGALAGLLMGAFGLLLVEPVMDRAVQMESARSAVTEAQEHEHAGASAGHHHGPEAVEVFTRGEQHLGLLVATVVTGLAIGVLFAVTYALVHRADPARDPWRRSLRLAAAGFVGAALLPFLRYPANPPGVGDSGTVGLRTIGWLAAIGLGLIAVAGAWRLNSWLAERQTFEPVRHLAVAAVPVAVLAAMFLLPDNPDALPVPAGMLWDFRVFSIASMALQWAALGAGFGLLNARALAGRRQARPVPSVAAASA
jgi:predicted cobalt transporter CbtA